MKRLACVFLLMTSLGAEEWHPSEAFLDAVRFVESADGLFLRGDGGKSLGAYQMSRAAWADVSQWRKQRGEPAFGYLQFVFDPEISRAYASDYIRILREQLRRHLKRAPTLGEIYAAYNMGLRGFARCQFNLERVNSTTSRKCREVERRAAMAKHVSAEAS